MVGVSKRSRPLSTFLSVRLDADEEAKLDALRGNLSRSDYIRGLIHNEHLSQTRKAPR